MAQRQGKIVNPIELGVVSTDVNWVTYSPLALAFRLKFF